MSIATDEANRNFSLPGNHGAPAFNLYWLKVQQQEAYIAGRTAELTEAEIEAGAKAMYDELCGNLIHGWLDKNGDPQMDEDSYRTVFINATVEALTAARKAVTE